MPFVEISECRKDESTSWTRRHIPDSAASFLAKAPKTTQHLLHDIAIGGPLNADVGVIS